MRSEWFGSVPGHTSWCRMGDNGATPRLRFWFVILFYWCLLKYALHLPHGYAVRAKVLCTTSWRCFFYNKTKSMLHNLGLQNYEKNFRKGLLTDSTLPLLTDRQVLGFSSSYILTYFFTIFLNDYSLAMYLYCNGPDWPCFNTFKASPAVIAIIPSKKVQFFILVPYFLMLTPTNSLFY